MRSAEYRAWLSAQGFAVNTVSTRLSDAKRVESFYGDLDEAFDKDGAASLLSALAYSGADRADKKLNPSLIPIEGNLYDSLASYRSAVTAYGRYRAASHAQPTPTPDHLAIDRADIVAAVGRCEAAGSVEAYLATLAGLGKPHSYWLLHEGRRYPSKAIVNDAYRRKGGDPASLIGGSQSKALLERLGFVVIDWPAFEKARVAFLSRMEGFGTFADGAGAYWDVERRYKNEVIAEVRSLVAGAGEDGEVGRAVVRALTLGRQGLPLSWRTLGEVEKADPALRDRFYGAVGRLARAPDGETAIAEAARELEALRAAGIAGLRRGEVLAIPISVWGTLHPNEATWFKVSRIETMGQRLFGRRLFARDRFEPADLDEYLQLVRALFALFDRELDWRPADLFDVQSFVWVALDDKWEAAVGPDLEPEPDPAIELDPDASYWFVGASFGRVDDQTEHFIRDGVWRIDSPTAGQRAQVARMRAGERIAIKAAFVQRDRLPFDAGGKRVSVMRVKARGVITEASTDGESVRVAWEVGFAPRDWYFYTYQPTIWQVTTAKEMGRRLIRFAFTDEEQDIAWFQANGWPNSAVEEPEAIAPALAADPVNLILYGSPGTGKTHRTVAEAVRLARGLKDDDPLLTDPARRGDLRAAFEEMRGQGQIAFVTFHQNYAYEDFIEGLRPRAALGGGITLEPVAGVFRRIAEAAGASAEEHILIIDEINRANISKVFGELITLIERDKRLGMGEGTRLTLPYSGLSFGVPANLHIIGTMNTADRSIALLDTALRRRFDFCELMPDASRLGVVDGIDLERLLTRLNDRIEYLFDREHQIGHAFFMPCTSRADVDAAMRRKVVPLLAEYFHEDWGKIAAVLGDPKGERFLRREVLTAPEGLEGESGGERYRWSVREPFANEAYAGL